MKTYIVEEYQQRLVHFHASFPDDAEPTLAEIRTKAYEGKEDVQQCDVDDVHVYDSQGEPVEE